MWSHGDDECKFIHSTFRSCLLVSRSQAINCLKKELGDDEDDQGEDHDDDEDPPPKTQAEKTPGTNLLPFISYILRLLLQAFFEALGIAETLNFGLIRCFLSLWGRRPRIELLANPRAVIHVTLIFGTGGVFFRVGEAKEQGIEEHSTSGKKVREFHSRYTGTLH